MPDVYSIASGPNDAHDYGGAGVVSDLSLIFGTTENWIGLRFVNVVRPAGGTLIAAKLVLWGNVTPAVTFTSELRGENSASSVDFATSPDISGRAMLATAVSWSDSVVSGAETDSPDLTTLVNAMMGVSGWASGDAITFLWRGNADGGVYGTPAAWIARDGSASEQPRLELEWSVPVTVDAVPHAVVIQSVPTVAGLGHDVAPVPVAVEAAGPSAVLSADQAIATPPPGVVLAAVTGVLAVGAEEQDEPAAGYLASGSAVPGLGWTEDVVSHAVEASAPNVVTTASASLEPPPAAGLLGNPPTLVQIELIALPDPVVAAVGRGPGDVTAGGGVAATVISVAISGLSAVISPGLTSTPVPAVGVLGSVPSVVSIETIGLPAPRVAAVGRVPGQVTGGVDVAASQVSVAIGGPPAVVSPGLTPAAVPVVGVLGAPPSVVSIETTARPSPWAATVGRTPGVVTAGVDVTASEISLAIGGAPAVLSPGLTPAAVPGVGVLGAPRHATSIETIAQPGPLVATVGRGPGVITAGGEVAATEISLVIGGPPAVVSPGISAAAVPGVGVIGTPPAAASIETIALPDPLVATIGRGPGVVTGGGDVAATEISLVIGGPPAVVSPGISAAAVPGVGVIGTPPAAASIETILEQPPSLIECGVIRAVPGLGHILAPTPLPLILDAASQVQGGALVSPQPSAIGGVGVGGAISVGSAIAVAAISCQASGVVSTMTISGEILGTPAGLSPSRSPATIAVGVVLNPAAAAVVIDVLALHGIGAVHILGPDLFYTLPESRLHYTLFS